MLFNPEDKMEFLGKKIEGASFVFVMLGLYFLMAGSPLWVTYFIIAYFIADDVDSNSDDS